MRQENESWVAGLTKVIAELRGTCADLRSDVEQGRKDGDAMMLEKSAMQQVIDSLRQERAAR